MAEAAGTDEDNRELTGPREASVRNGARCHHNVLLREHVRVLVGVQRCRPCESASPRKRQVPRGPRGAVAAEEPISIVQCEFVGIFFVVKDRKSSADARGAFSPA
jgi:hypothetical protein